MEWIAANSEIARAASETVKSLITGVSFRVDAVAAVTLITAPPTLAALVFEFMDHRFNNELDVGVTEFADPHIVYGSDRGGDAGAEIVIHPNDFSFAVPGKQSMCPLVRKIKENNGQVI